MVTKIERERRKSYNLLLDQLINDGEAIAVFEHTTKSGKHKTKSAIMTTRGHNILKEQYPEFVMCK